MEITTMKHSLIAIALGAVLALPQTVAALAADTPALPATASHTQLQPVRGYLGVTINRLPEPVRVQLPDAIPREQGLLVEQVMENSPAEKAGLQPFDILLQYNDQKLFSPEQFIQLVGSDHGGQAAKLTIVRAGKVSTVDVTLGEVSQPEAANRLSRLEALPPHGTHRHLFGGPGQQARQGNEGVWESFDSMSLDKVGNDKYKAVIGYLTEDGKHQRREFQGSRDDIRRQILAQKDLPSIERDQLLDALSSRGDVFPSDAWAMVPLEHELLAAPAWWGWYPDF
jgi:membrane-associated protease RseP (regulator of RpoE activity)